MLNMLINMTRVSPPVSPRVSPATAPRQPRVADLQQQVVDGGLDLQRQAVAGVVLAEGEFVVDAEHGHGGHGRGGLRRLLVALAALQHLALQLLQLQPGTHRGIVDNVGTARLNTNARVTMWLMVGCRSCNGALWVV